MQDKLIKVGDVVPWDMVPSGALVRHEGNKQWNHGHALRIGTTGTWVEELDEWYVWDGDWYWEMGGSGSITIIALGLTGQESANDLRRLAEVFEVREALVVEVASQRPDRPGGLWPWTHLFDEAFDRGRLRRCEVAECPGGLRCVTLLAELAARLHAAGWRPGMTAEDAARLLAAQTP